MMREQGLEGNQTRVGMEDGTRDCPQPEDHYGAENDEQFYPISHVMANALGQ